MSELFLDKRIRCLTLLATVLDLNTVGPSPLEMVPFPIPATTLGQEPKMLELFSSNGNFPLGVEALFARSSLLKR